MSPSRCVLLACALVGACYAGTIDEDKTTEAVVKAVVDAESLPGGLPKVTKEAVAAGDATMEVLKSEGNVEDKVPEEVLNRAQDLAEETLEELEEAKVDPKAAADASAKVAIAEIDGATNGQLDERVTENAEKAAVSAVKGVDENPNKQSEALSEAITNVEKEEQTPGSPDVTSEEGVVSKVEESVEEIPKMTEETVEEGLQEVASHRGSEIFLVFIVLLGLTAYFYKVYNEKIQASSYMKGIRASHDEEHGTSTGVHREQYMEMR